jgi:hypothetical protein
MPCLKVNAQKKDQEHKIINACKNIATYKQQLATILQEKKAHKDWVVKFGTMLTSDFTSASRLLANNPPHSPLFSQLCTTPPLKITL